MSADLVWHAVLAAREALPRPIAPAAVALLAEHQELLEHFGGLAGELDVAEAAATLKWAVLVLDALLLIAGGATETFRAVRRPGVSPLTLAAYRVHNADRTTQPRPSRSMAPSVRWSWKRRMGEGSWGWGRRRSSRRRSWG